MGANEADNAVWWVAAAGAFLAWQGAAWLTARGRWQRARERGVSLPAPRFMQGPADFLADALPVLLGLAQVAAGIAWGFLALFAIGFPLGLAYGWPAGLAGGVMVFWTGGGVWIAAVQRIAERQRHDRELAAHRARAGVAD